MPYHAGMSDPVADAVQACQQLRDIRDDTDRVLNQRDAALLAIHQQLHVPKRQVGRKVREALAGEGWTPEQIAAVGVSDSSVEIALRRR